MQDGVKQRSKTITSQLYCHNQEVVALLKTNRLTVSAGNSESKPLVDSAIKAVFNCKGVSVFGGLGVGAVTASVNLGSGSNSETQRGRIAWVML